jgi:hypothetical protein
VSRPMLRNGPPFSRDSRAVRAEYLPQLTGHTGVDISVRRCEWVARGAQRVDCIGKQILAHEAVPEMQLGEAVVRGERNGPREERLCVLEPVGQQGNVADPCSGVRVVRIPPQHAFEGPFGLVEPALAQELIGVVVWQDAMVVPALLGGCSTRCALQQWKRRRYAGSQPGSTQERAPVGVVQVI